MNFKNTSSFTLVELLIVMGILAILAAVVILVINPAEFLKQARDSTRMSELQELNKAISVYQADGKTSFGSSSVVYVSIPDSSLTCNNLGLPNPPSGWSYHCVASSTLRNVDSYGWIPVNLTSISWGTPLNALPIDPINTTSTGNYYTYVTGGSWKLATLFESQKYTEKAAKDGGSDLAEYEIGTNLTLLPVSRDPSLVGYWKFDETSGTNVYDASGKGNNGTLSTGTSTPGWTSGKVNGALSFDGNDYIDAGNAASLNITDAMTVVSWVNFSSIDYVGGTGGLFGIAGKGYPDTASPHFGWWFHYDNRGNANHFSYTCFGNSNGGYNGGGNTFSRYQYNFQNGIWYQVAFTINQTEARLFINGVQQGATKSISNLSLSDTSRNLFIGTAAGTFKGLIDDVRIYNRALSAAEISAIYNATK